MHSGRKYKLKEYIFWSRKSIYYLFFLAVIPTSLYKIAGFQWLTIPWPPVTLIGTAAAFIMGFKNNAAYARSWEARQVWGSIVNCSRIYAVMIKDYIKESDKMDLKRQQEILINRHIAWLTALRFQLREVRQWENVKVQAKYLEYSKKFSVPEWENTMDDELKLLLSPHELEMIMAKSNKAAQLLMLQTNHLKKLNENGALENIKHVEIVQVIKDLFEQQGKCERIKNFPYPRQFASVSDIFINLFVLMVPLGILKEFDALGPYAIWLTIPFSIIVSWVFLILEFVGESTENPFEGGSNDIPISSLSRSIEIDIREMSGQDNIPKPLSPTNNILM